MTRGKGGENGEGSKQQDIRSEEAEARQSQGKGVVSREKERGERQDKCWGKGGKNMSGEGR